MAFTTRKTARRPPSPSWWPSLRRTFAPARRPGFRTDVEAVPLSKHVDGEDVEPDDGDAPFANLVELLPEERAQVRMASRFGRLMMCLVLLVFIGFVVAGPVDLSRRTGLVNPKLVHQHLQNGATILGSYRDVRGPKTTWMRKVPDSTPLTKINLPGVHDAATWNYSQATQDRWLDITGTIPPADIFRCQTRSFFQMLADGIRVFDLRIGFLPPPAYRFSSGPPSPDGTLIGFYHNVALLSPTAELIDVLYGFYKFLDDHPTETLMLSVKADNTTWQPSQFALEEAVYNLTTQGLGRHFWVQDLASVGTLGQARGKITLLNRLAYDSLIPPAAFPDSTLGVALPPALWTDNSPTPFSIPYNNATNASAFIEDYYEIQGVAGIDHRVSGKYAAVEEHLLLAANATGAEADELYITFSSAEADDDSPPVTPQIMAIGDGNVTGVNQRLEMLLKGSFGKSRKRLGVIFIDWYHSVQGLVDAILALQ